MFYRTYTFQETIFYKQWTENELDFYLQMSPDQNGRINRSTFCIII